MAEKKWKTGDLVTLKSNQLRMTISHYHPEDSTRVVCIWIYKGEKRSDSFEQETLKSIR